ncbi:hypothetical protein DYI37_03850 [Fulvimarina endophytica]|uniref:Portal protein n=1 Tax=Fulvimarina endophytica TaxID=2293836 RepID=A0A371X6Z9_9HYPH|nr:hypothetical protein [Fulvimarina endophytica]RFC65009.1 hypothetical protein DYI37_03850 [Fulvimarina endophytica]
MDRSTALAVQKPEVNPVTLGERLASVVDNLTKEVRDRIDKRLPLEQRWLDDLAQYHGRYDEATDKSLRAAGKSKLFVNLTRPKTNAMSARLMDLLFPTDDRNWGIQPTPVPLLIEDAANSVRALQEIEKQLKAVQDQQAEAATGPNGAPAGQPDPKLKELQDKAAFASEKAKSLREILDEATKRSEAMTAEIDDQLRASSYHAAMRDMIDDACKYGTGVCKGPITGDRVRKGWKKQKDGERAGEFQMIVEEEAPTPSMRYVDLWHFFPDMDARTIQDGEGDFERHLMNEKQLRKLSRLPGFDKDAIRRLLKAKPKQETPSFVTQIRDITQQLNAVGKQTYHVFEYSGPLSAEDVRTIALAKQDDETLADVEDLDPLDEINVVLWFCDREVLKIAPYPFDSGETIYSVFNLEKDEGSLFGYGIPYIMADPQRSLNAGWRAMLDNAAIASGPQFVMDQNVIEPANGEWKIEPRKVWLAKKGVPKDQLPLTAVKIDMHQEELANIIAISKQFIDDMTAMPSIAQGEQGATPQKTAFGQALLMNAANVTFRRIVKNFDDDVTVPNITRFYDWNMQFSPKDEIKGDYGVDARGSSVLLVREMQAQNLMVIATQLGGHPVYGAMLKNRPLLKKLFQSMMVPADEVLLTEEEIDAIMAKASEPPSDPAADAKAIEIEFKREELSVKVELANMEAGTRVRVAELNHETAMMTLAEKMNMQMDQLRAMMAKSEREIASKERMFAAEAAMTERTGPTGGGNF